MNDFQTKRLGKFTASEIWKLFVEPRKKTDKWSETAKTYILEKAVQQVTGYRKQFTSKEMEHGIMTEPEAFDAWKKLSRLYWEYTSQEFFTIGDNAGASPDGVVYDGLDIIAVCDIKCPQPLTFMELIAEKPEIDDKYFYQLQMQMLATKCDVGYLVYYLANEFVNTYTNEVEFKFDRPIEKRLFVQQVKADQSVQDQIMLKIADAEIYKQQLIQSII